MVASMTGFSCCTQKASWGTLVWELRSVNHRYLELSIRLPESLRQQEMLVRERIQRCIKRGKVEATLKFSPSTEMAPVFVVNEPLLRQLATASATVAQYFPQGVVNSLEVLNWQGVLGSQSVPVEDITEAAFTLLDQTLADLTAARAREGESLNIFLQNRLQHIDKCVKNVEKFLPKLKEQCCEKIKSRFVELTLEVNAERLEQELVWLLQKIDVAEEVQRLYAHMQEVKRILTSNDGIGRRLDFLMQELNREANTLGSKSMDSQVTQWVVDMKVQIEQMREQVQNIE